MRLRINKHKIFSTVLNVIGLTLAFTIFLVLMVQVIYDLGFDRGYPDADKIVKLEFSNPTTPGVYGANFSRPFIEYIKEHIPQAEAVTCIEYGGRSTFKKIDSETSGVLLSYIFSDYDLVRVFPFEFTQGDSSAFQTAGTILISESAAKKLFGKESPIGKDLTGEGLRVVAMYKDFPENSTMHYDLIVNIGNRFIDDRSEWHFPCYMKLTTTEGLKPVLDSLKSSPYFSYTEQADIRAIPLHDVYFAQDSSGSRKGNFTTTMTLLTIIILIIVIAIINFINFAMASVPFIIKGINTRRVIGSTRGQQIWVQLGRTILLVLLAFGLGIGAMSLISTSSFASNISGSLRPEDNLPLIFLGLGVAVATAFIAGIFPARYSTSFNPALVLKGSFSLSAKGRAMRTALIGFQYVISFILVICALFITVQIKYMQSFDMGFNREEVVEFFINYKIGNNRETLKQMLLANPNITDVTFTDRPVVGSSHMGWGRPYQGEFVQMNCLPVDPNFISFFGMEVVEGRDFTETDNLNPDGTFIVNQAFMTKYPFLHLGSKFDGHRDDDRLAAIVGIVKDFNFNSLQYGIAPLALYNFGSEPWRPLCVAYARIAPAQVQETFKYIREKCEELDPTFNASEMNIRFLDEAIDMLYWKEENLNRLITIAAFISLLISVIGILGLVYFETQFRRKEIALRRIHGAQIGEILRMLNRYYLTITVVCFVVAVPVAIVTIRHWVSSFTYQSPVPVWIFAVALILIAAITAVTVTLQSRRAALRNPIESITNE